MTAKRPGFMICICPDAELVREEIFSRLARHPAPDNHGLWSLSVYWGDDPIPKGFWTDLTTPSLMGGCRAVILRRAHAQEASFWEALSPVLAVHRDTIFPFFCLEGPWKSKGPALPKSLESAKYWQLAEKRGWVWRSPGLQPRDVRRKIQAWAGEREIAIQGGVLDRLAAALPLDQSALKRELEKFELFVGSAGLLDEKALGLLTDRHDLDIFAFLRILRNPKARDQAWEHVLSKADDPSFTLQFCGLLLWEARSMWQILAGESGAVRLPPAVKRDKEHAARALGFQGLARIWPLVLKTERGIKSGSVHPDQALECLVANLMRLFEPTRI